ncbi:MAG: DNA-directed RNA polymerase subunit beta [Chloroflexi bacterium RBG_19FT_COMBO_47_15]|nr:MAG: DNA-directed RNA polymerase subunit beta [Chloroflexi bacterium RBG_19FT_COMBO_47_15]
MSISLVSEGRSIDLEGRKSFAKLPEVLEIPNLIKVQLDSFRWFQEEGLSELFQEVSPIHDFTGTRLELHFVGYEFRQPLCSVDQCRQRDITYAAPLYVRAKLLVKDTGEIKEQEVFFGDIPIMTEKGTFIISGAERVVVNQLLRSPGIYFSLQQDPASGRELCAAKLIPEHGAWLEFETSNRDVIFVKVDGKRKIPVAILLRAIGYDEDSELLELFRDVETSSEHTFIQSTIEREPSVSTREKALVDIYKRLRPGEPPTHENAQTLLNNLFFNPRRYDLGRVGRYKLNNRLGLDIDERRRCLTKEDFIEIVRRIIKVNNGKEEPDDIDHLRNRRVRTAGNLIQNQFRIGLLRLERAIKERMSIVGPEAATPSTLINNRPIVAAVREFFGGSQLSQFMDQTNPLAELTHKRRLSAMGPGGLSRERAGFDVRDVHHSHYGKICPIETPEGPNIGLIGSLATYASINDYGFIQTPYRKVIHEVPNNVESLINRKVLEDTTDSKGNVIASKRTLITKEIAKKISSLSSETIRVVPFVSGQIVNLTADEEELYAIAQANTILNQRDEFVEDRIGVIRGGKYLKEPADKIDFMDVSPKQVFSVTTSLIPFLEHDDANRALMGSNMQRQAVPLLRPEAPLIATGMEKEVAKYSGQVVFSREDGEVVSVDTTQVTIAEENGNEHIYPLMKFVRTNQGTCVNQRPIVSKGDKVKKGQVMADGSATDHGELALGQNIICAFMSWRGYNFEDAIIISDRLVKNDRFTSIHIEKYEIEARETKLGTEEITRDIPNVGEESLRDLDESGIIRIGAEVGPGSILVGKISPKGETELTAEEKLLRAIFGEKAREVKDSSLRVPHGECGKVIDVKVFSRDNHTDLPAGVYCLIRVWVAQKRKISVGDKMAGRHGNKGVISCILPEEDMPFLPDGRPVDIILNPIGVPSRMNIGQILETHLGWAAETLGLKVLNPIFDGANDVAIEDALARAWIVQQAGVINRAGRGDSKTVELNQAKTWLADNGYNAEKVFDDRYPVEARRVCLRLWLETLGVKVYGLSDEEVDGAVEKVYLEQRQSPPIFGKVNLCDGRTGESFDQPVTVGSIYMMKLIHLVEDKVHARSTGPYSLITQQPLGGKAQFGGQRFGEMEVWALEAYGASHTLQELLTIKSDDVAGRAKAYEALVKGEDIFQPGVPESFKVLFMELRSLCLAVELLNEEEEMVSFLEERKKIGTKLRGLS